MIYLNYGPWQRSTVGLLLRKVGSITGQGHKLINVLKSRLKLGQVWPGCFLCTYAKAIRILIFGKLGKVVLILKIVNLLRK